MLHRPPPVALSLAAIWDSFSSSSTFLPLRAAVMAAMRPAAPPPTTMTSYDTFVWINETHP